jgi:hypothetical protein
VGHPPRGIAAAIQFGQRKVFFEPRDLRIESVTAETGQ